MDRNWSELLQELRVTQTGAQVLLAFLLTIPFQQRFDSLDDDQMRAYLVLVLLATTATGLLVAPVSLHRFLFRQRRKSETVTVGHRLALAGLVVLGLTIVGTVVFVFDVVVSRDVGLIAGAGVLMMLTVLWLLVPWWATRGSPSGSDG
jgi:RsiW-degrading membrane proteinase PrsW (M82 family)